VIEASTKRFPQGISGKPGLSRKNEWAENFRPNRVEPSKVMDPEANLSLGVFIYLVNLYGQ